LLDRFQDLLDHSIGIPENAVVPEAQNAKAAVPQIGIASLVTCALNMLTAIRFNDEHLFERHKIDDPGPERDLPAEFDMGELP
jgi:hypothetical protein